MDDHELYKRLNALTLDVGLLHRKVDFLFRHLNVAFQDVRPPPNEIEQLLIASDRLGAMKLYQQKFNVGLAEAKRAVDEMAAKLGLP
jgi:hypothetical protein